MKLTIRFSYFFYLFIWISCARPVQPTGGPKDTTPPQLKKEKSSAFNLTHFTKQNLIFNFDEFLILDKAEQQILISPPLQYKPTVKIKDKAVLFAFDDREELKPNTTYIINFGESVKDYTEGNVVPDFRYVFSTGDVIDSLELQAIIVDAATGKPSDNTLLMLYRDFSDSVVYKILPDYAGRSNKNGEVFLHNLKAGHYQVVALKDDNLNYKYDLTNEKAGFVRDTIALPFSGKPLKIQVFSKEIPPKITSVDSTSNQRIRFVVDPSTAGFKIRSLDDKLQPRIKIGEQLIDVYYGDTLRQVNLEITKPGFKPDTIRQKLSPKWADRKVRLAEERTEIKTFPYIPGKPVRLNFNSGIYSFHKELMQLSTQRDTIPLDFSATVDSLNQNNILIKSNWLADTSYVLKMIPGALKDLLGNENDSLLIRFKIIDPTTLSSIVLQIDSLNASFDYIIQLVKSNEIWKKWHLSDTNSFKTDVEGLPAESYQIDILEDRNKNGKIDKGSFILKEDPENIYSRKLEPLRQNWSIEVIINMNDFKSNSTLDK